MPKIDGRSRYNKICKLLKPIVNQDISLNRLRRRVMIEIGCGDKLVGESISLMINLGLIYECEEWVYHVSSYEADI